MSSIRASIYLGVSLIALAASPAFAQTAPPAEAGPGAQEDIIVTARRREESVQDVPQVVNVVTGDELRKLNIRNFTDVQTLVPGLQLRRESNGIGTSAQLRGVQFDPNTGAAASVAFYFNDAVIQGNAVLQTTYDIGQIEVQRGPQGTLRGVPTPSGSISLTTRKPDLYRIGGYVQATGNDIGTINVNGGVSVPIIKGIAALRVAGAIEESDSNRVRTIQTNLDSRDPYYRSSSGRATLLVTPTDYLRLEGTYQRQVVYQRDFQPYESYSLANPAAAPSPVLITPGDQRSIAETPNTVHQFYNIFNGRAELRLAGQRLIYQFQHVDFNVHSLTNQDFANFLVGRDFYQETDTSAQYTTHEVRLQNEERVLGAFDYVIGAFDSRSSVTSNFIQQTPVLLPAAFGGGIATVAITPINLLGPISHERSFFGNLTYHLDNSTEISGGVRRVTNHTPTGGLVIAGTLNPTPAVNDHGFIYAATIKHNFSPNLLVYANTGTSRRPGPNVVADFSAQKSALENSFLYLPSETSTNYEAGVKATLFDRKLVLNVSGFHQNFKNFPYRNPTGTYFVNYQTTVSGGVTTVTPGVSSANFVAPVPVEVNGGELELSATLNRNFTVGILASYALGKIKNGVVPCNDANQDGIPDASPVQPTLAVLQAQVGANNLATCKVTQRSAFQSPFSLTAQGEFHHPVTPGVDGYLRGLFTYNGKNLNDPTFAYDDVGGFGLLNLYTGIRDPKGAWEISLFAKNLLNTAKATSVSLPATTSYQRLNTSFVASAATATSTYSQIGLTPPREFGLNVRFAFGAR